jgi:hypothetical protein
LASEQRAQLLPYYQNEEAISSDGLPLGAQEKKTETGISKEMSVQSKRLLLRETESLAGAWLELQLAAVVESLIS